MGSQFFYHPLQKNRPSARFRINSSPMSPLRAHLQQQDLSKRASLQSLTKVDGLLSNIFHSRATGMLTGPNVAEEMRQVWRLSDVLKARFKKPPTLDDALNHVGDLIRNGEPTPIIKKASLTAHLRAARNKTHQHPTEAQRHAGNYAKGRLNFRGLSIAIENPIDSIRRGTDDSGKAWESRLTADYGYFVGSTAADGDAVDVFIGPDHASDLVVVVDQYKGAAFDESKFILAVITQQQGEALYLSNYQKGWKLGPVSTTTVQQLKTWLAEGNTKAPFKGQLVKAADWQNTCPSCGAEGNYGGDREKPSKELCYKCAEKLQPKCEHGVTVPFNTCDYGCKEPIEKSAAEMKRKTVMVPSHSDHCPHCDFEFQEKCYPRMKRDGKDVDDRAAAYDSGDYDEHCPSCDGVIDQKERTDDEINNPAWLFPGSVEKALARRETQRKRKAARETEKSAAVLPALLLKLQALSQRAASKLPTMDTAGRGLTRVVTELGKRPQLEERVRAALNYRLLDVRNQGKNLMFGQVAGGAIGGATGLATGAHGGEGGWVDHLTGGAVGAATGALGGRSAARHLPRLAQKGIGRVLTNLMDPVSYNDEAHASALKGYSIKEMLRAVVTDTPISKIRPPEGVPFPKEWQKDKPRDAMFRDYFGMDRRKGSVTTFQQLGVGPDGGKIVKHNPATHSGREELAGVEDAIVRSVSRRGEGARHMQKDKPTLVNTGAMANFHVNPDGTWQDTWDFARNGGEKIDSVPNLLRALVTPFGTPSTIVGKTLSQREALSRAGYGRDSAHESFGAFM